MPRAQNSLTSEEKETKKEKKKKRKKIKRCLSLADSDDSDDEPIYTHKKPKKIKRHLSLADNDDSDDDSTQPSAGVFGVESGSDDANSAWNCVVAVRRSNDNESTDVFNDAAWYCCNCFLWLCFICMGVRIGFWIFLSSRLLAL